MHFRPTMVAAANWATLPIWSKSSNIALHSLSVVALPLVPRAQVPGTPSPLDRPWLRLDLSAGTIYLSSYGLPQRYLVASHDNGATWTEIEALDCDDSGTGELVDCSQAPAAPVIGRRGRPGGTIDAALGMLAATYWASGPNPDENWLMFETSGDDGHTWQRH